MHDWARVIEPLYSAAIHATEWPAVVEALQSHFGSTCAGIYSIDLERRAAQAIHLSDLSPDTVRIYCDEYLMANPWEVQALQVPGRVRTDRSLDEHYNLPGYYRRTSLFNDFMKPRDFIHTLGVNVIDDRRARVRLFLYRPGRYDPYSDEDVRDLSHLTGHLTNAVTLARRIAEEQIQAKLTLDILDRFSFGVVLLDERGRVLEANSRAASMFRTRDGLYVDGDSLVVSHRNDAASLAAALRAALEVRARQSFDAPRAVRLRRESGRRGVQVIFIPLPGRTDDPFLLRPAAIAAVITDSERESAIPSLDLELRYGLTRTEASLAQSLVRGISLREAASAAGVTYETGRTYLKSILQKTGTSRQAELVSLLLSERLLVDTDSLALRP